MNRELTTDEVKKIQINILDIIVEFCTINNIKYFLGYGTLIGSIRHKGYIPWDDDIDIAMMRSDYEKFVSTFAHENYRVFTSSNTNWYPFPFAKVSYNNSIIEENYDNNQRKFGVNVDVFPLDKIPEEDSERRKLFSNISYLRKKINIKLITINSKRSRIKNFILHTGKILLRNKNMNSIANEMIQISMKYENLETKFVGNVVWGYGKRETVSKQIFDDFIYSEFENKNYIIPVGYDEWLKNIYGNYLQLPPIDKQVTHHEYKAFIIE